MNKTLASIKADKRRVLLVTADPLLQARFRTLLADMRHGAYEVDEIEDCRGVHPSMTSSYDACIVSLKNRSAANVSEMLGELAEAVDSPVIVVADCRESGLAAIHAGADDYLESSTLSPELVDRSIRYVLQKREMARQSARLACEQSARAVIQKRNFRLHLLCEAASELLSVEDPVELLGRLYPKLAAHLGLDCFAHHLVDEHTDTLALQASSGIPAEAMDRVQRLDFSAVLSRQPGFGDEQDTSLLAESLGSLLNVRACFCYPLMVHGYILGTLSFGSRRRARFSSSELVFLKTVCHYVAAALDRKRLAWGVPVRDATGRIMGGLAVSVDITDLKRPQRQLLELHDALEQRVRDRTRSLLTYQEHLRAMTSELVLTEQRERRRLATELHDYLAQLLVASKMKSKLLTHHVEPSGSEVMQDLRDLIDEALKYTRTLIADLSPTILYEAGLFTAIHWLGEQMQRHNLTVRIEEEVEPLDIPDDKAVMIFQTIRELLFNVVKHARVHEATVRLEQSAAGELVVTVEDAGAGFDPSRQEFHPAGGKFGLFSVRERLVALGGVFELRSTPGEGTRAMIRVPVEPRPIGEDAAGPIVATALPASAEMRRRDTIRVLLADDHKMVREGFRTLIECDPQLEVAGEAANGEEALEFARLLQPDVVIMDINMPRMNGIEATRRLKLELPHIAVIGLSVHDDRGLIASMLEAGASMYLTKGGQSEELSRAIHSTYEQQVDRPDAQSEL